MLFLSERLLETLYIGQPLQRLSSAATKATEESQNILL